MKKVLLYSDRSQRAELTNQISDGLNQTEAVLDAYKKTGWAEPTPEEVLALITDPVNYCGSRLAVKSGLAFKPAVMVDATTQTEVHDLISAVKSVDRHAVSLVLGNGAVIKNWRVKITSAQTDAILSQSERYATTSDEVELYRIFEQLAAVRRSFMAFGAHEGTLVRVPMGAFFKEISDSEFTIDWNTFRQILKK